MKPEAPEDWTLERLGNVAEVLLSNVDKKSSAKDVPVRLCNYMDVYTNPRITADLPLMEATATPAQVEKFGLRVGDVVITKDSEDPSDIAVPSVVVDEFNGSVVCGYHLAILRPREVDGAYLSWTLRSRPVNDQFTRRANGSTRFGLTNRVIQSTWIPLPPVPEQRKIAAILSSVDDAIAATRKVIEQTKRVKQGLLQTLMTRGIGHTRFKKTAIGEIPEAWEVVPLGTVATLQRGFDITVAEQNPGDVPVVSSSGINSWHDKAMVQPPGVVTGRKGALGSVYYLDVPFWPHDTSLWVKDFHGNDSRWVAWLLRSLRLERYDAATSVPTLNRNNVHPLRVRRPPVREQAEIADRLDHLNSVLVEQEKVVAELGRVKRGLMQDLLTGRVRVQPD